MTADEPMSTPDSGGLRFGIDLLREVLIDFAEWLGDDGEAKWAADKYLCESGKQPLSPATRALLAAHPEPVPTPDSADDATVGEREATHPHAKAVRGYLDNAGITPETLRYAATHEALCRSWIFDLLTGLADTMDQENR